MADRRPSVIDLMERNAMWIVRLALPWPCTFIVVSILILIMGMLAIVRAQPIFFRTSTFRLSAASGTITVSSLRT
jgi:hypothetical protein